MKKYLSMLPILATLSLVLGGCIINISTGGSNTPQCTSNCAAGSGAQGARVYVEPDDGEQIITGAIRGARKSVWLEIYILSDRNVIRALEDAANNSIDVRVMLEPHPFGGGSSPSKTIDQLKATGARAQYTSPDFTLTHEKGLIIDSSTEQALTSAAQHGVHVEVILPAPSGSSGDSNSQGIATIKQGGVQVREDSQLYMHAKIIVVDGVKAFVGSENISSQSLDQNRELGIIVSDATVLNRLQSTFQTDWGVSQGV